MDQTRGWFYSLHAISTLLFNEVSFKNVISLGHILDAEGQKMSKSRGNVIAPWDVLNAHGADAVRWYLYTATPPGQERRFSSDLVGEVIRSFTLTLWNVYSFFVTYANLDKPDVTTLPIATGDLDRWLLSELNVLVRDVTAAYESYDVTNATRPIEAFVEKMSTWYLRRSRRRFWKSESDSDKQAAYSTLYTALVTVAKLLAPAMPFLAEELYQNLVRSLDETAPESVHLASWPEVLPEMIDESLNRDMELVMRLVSLGHAARQKANRKVRQPLAEAAFSVGNARERAAVADVCRPVPGRTERQAGPPVERRHRGAFTYGQAAAQTAGTEVWQQIPGHPEGHPAHEQRGSLPAAPGGQNRCMSRQRARYLISCRRRWRSRQWRRRALPSPRMAPMSPRWSPI